MFLMRDEKEERKKQARLNKQTRQSNTAHPRQSLFLRNSLHDYSDDAPILTGLHVIHIIATYMFLNER